MADPLGGQGNGSAWWAESNAQITDMDIYQGFSQTAIANINITALKGVLGAALPSAEGAPLINYLKWVLDMAQAVA